MRLGPASIVQFSPVVTVTGVSFQVFFTTPTRYNIDSIILHFGISLLHVADRRPEVRAKDLILNIWHVMMSASLDDVAVSRSTRFFPI